MPIATGVPSRTKLDALLREKVMAIITATLIAEGLAPAKSAGGTLLFEMPDELHDERYVKVDVVVPKGSRDGEPFDGKALVDEYNANIVLKAEETALRAKTSLEKQAKRAEKDKAKADKAKADAEASAEDTEEPAEEVTA
jgi:hypothetical protein